MRLFDVRKNKIQRIGLLIFSVIFVAFIGVPILCWEQPWEYMLFLFLPYDLLLLAVLLYYETWYISFFSDKICKKVFGKKVGTYYYAMIKDAYVNGRGLLVIRFKNGKKILLKSDYENIDKAMKKIETYCSIKLK